MEKLQLRVLRRQQTATKAQLTKLENTLDDKRSLFTDEKLSVYELQLNKITQRFQDNQKEIYSLSDLTDADFEDEQAEDSSFDDRVIAAQIKIKQLRHALPGHATSTVQQGSTTDQTKLWEEQQKLNNSLVESLKLIAPRDHQNQVKLPQLEIPKFTGKYSEWSAFHDLYLCTIHNNNSLSAVQKFQYLKSYLTEDAETVIKHLSVSEENYEIAWKLVKERFEKKQNIVSAHIQAFLTQPTITESDASSLRDMFNISQEVIHALDAIQCGKRDVWIVHILLSKMDQESKMLWSRETSSAEVPTLEKFFNFLERRCDSLEIVQEQHGVQSVNIKTEPAKGVPKQKTSLTVTEAIQCPICKEGAHKISQCTRFFNALPSQRMDLLKAAKLCTNCARGTHSVESCTSSNCRRCGMRHHTLLHEVFTQLVPITTVPTTDSSQGGDPGAPPAPIASPAASLMSRQAGKNQVVLPTVSLYLIDNDGKRHKARALLDSCSELNFITSKFVEKCKIPTYTKDNHTIVGIGSNTTEINTAVQATINSRFHTFAETCEFSLIEKITDDQPHNDLTGKLVIPSNVILADPEFFKTGRIDMLLGVDIFAKVSRPGRIEGNPTLLETAFGYIAAGILEIPGSTRSTSCFCLSLPTDALLQEIEESRNKEKPNTDKSILCREEDALKGHFTHHFTKDDTGRYIFYSPAKGNPQFLGKSCDLAVKQFLCDERRLLRETNTSIHEKCTTFLREYKQLQHTRDLFQSCQSEKPPVYSQHSATSSLKCTGRHCKLTFSEDPSHCRLLLLCDTLDEFVSTFIYLKIIRNGHLSAHWASSADPGGRLYSYNQTILVSIVPRLLVGVFLDTFRAFIWRWSKRKDVTHKNSDFLLKLALQNPGSMSQRSLSDKFGRCHQF